MPVYLDRKTKRLYIEFQYKNLRYKERLHKWATRKDAEKLEINKKNELMFERHGLAPVEVLTFEIFIDEYFGPEADNWNVQRRARAVILVKACMPFLRGKAMRDIEPADIERIKQARANLLTQHGTVRKPATIEREMAIISSIFSMAVTNNKIPYNPCSRVKRIKFNNEVDKILSREDEVKLFENIHSEWTRDICKMALHTGLRQNDIMRLTRFQVKFDENCIRLVQGKTQNKVVILLNDVSRAILERRCSTDGLLFPSPVTGTEKGSVRHTMLRACKRAGIEPYTIRDLRRTYITRNIESGTDAVTASKMAGHTSLRMIHRYVKSVDLMQQAADRMAENEVFKNVNPPNLLKLHK